MPTTEVKICGLTTCEDAHMALNAGADYLGFVLYPKSVRGITTDHLRSITSRLPDGTRAIGVFVNASRSQVIDVVRTCGLYAAQIHGDEAADGFRDMPVRIWRALHLQNDRCTPVPDDWPAERYVIDAAIPGMYGGTGVEADWRCARAVAAACPAMLAGGLNAENVAAAIRLVGPLGVDVASGVEATPGRKDARKVHEFVAAAKRAV